MAVFKKIIASFLCLGVMVESGAVARAIPNSRHIAPSDVLRVISTEKGLHSERCHFDLNECQTLSVLTPEIIEQARQNLADLDLKDFSRAGLSNELERPSWVVLGSYAAVITLAAFVMPGALRKLNTRIGLQHSTLHVLETLGVVLGTSAFAYDLRQRMLIGPQRQKANGLKTALLEAFDQTFGVLKQLPIGEVRTMALPQWLWDELDAVTEQASVDEEPRT